MMQTISKQQTILIVEDSEEDYEVTHRALTKANLRNPLIHCVDGQQAIDYIFHRGQYATLKPDRPGIILLDLNLPRVDGKTVLEMIKQDPYYKSIPVIVLTTSSDEHDITNCYGSGANTYITKPVDMDSFLRAIQRLKEYWFELAVLPKEDVD